MVLPGARKQVLFWAYLRVLLFDQNLAQAMTRKLEYAVTETVMSSSHNEKTSCSVDQLPLTEHFLGNRYRPLFHQEQRQPRIFIINFNLTKKHFHSLSLVTLNSMMFFFFFFTTRLRARVFCN